MGSGLALAAAVKPRSHNVRAYRRRAALNPTDRYAWALGVGVFVLVAVSGPGQTFQVSVGMYGKRKRIRRHSILKVPFFCYCRFDQSLHLPDYTGSNYY
jgi:hypothetical protein